MYLKALILSAQGVQDEEFLYPYYRLQEQGFDVKVGFVSTDKYRDHRGKYGISFPVDYDISSMNKESLNELVDRYDIFIIPGGWQAPEIMRMNQNVIYLLNKAHSVSKVIGAICHGPQVLISGKIGYGKEVTGFSGIWDDLRNAGYRNVDKGRVLVDNNIVTAQHYKDNPEFMKKVLEVYFNKYVPANYQG